MKRKIITIAVLLGALSVSGAFAQNLIQGMIPAGTCSLPAGRYMLTNINTGHALYLEVNSSGKIFAQDPSKMTITASAISSGYTAPAITEQTQPTQPTQTKGSMWGGLLKQGVNSLLTPNQTPAQ